MKQVYQNRESQKNGDLAFSNIASSSLGVTAGAMGVRSVSGSNQATPDYGSTPGGATTGSSDAIAVPSFMATNGRSSFVSGEGGNVHKITVSSEVLHNEEKDIEYVTPGGSIGSSHKGSTATRNHRITVGSEVVHNEEKEIEYVTPGGPDGDDGDGKGHDGDETDTSQSSQEEMDLIRSKIVAQSIASGVTPGGPDSFGTNVNASVNTNVNVNHGTGNSAEMDIELVKLMEEANNNKQAIAKSSNASDEKFKLMLTDNLTATDLIESDIVNEMNNDIDPNATATPGGQNGLDENGYGVTPGDDNHVSNGSNNVQNGEGEGEGEGGFVE